MRKGLVCLWYSIIFIIAIYNVIAQYKRKKVINTFICFQAAFILYYIFIPIMAQLVIEFYPNEINGFVFGISQAEPYEIVYSAIYTTAAYFMILFVYFIRIRPRAYEFNVSTTKNIENNEVDYSDKMIYQIAVTSGILFLIVGIAAELYISNCLGGIFKAIAMGDRLRAFGSDRTNYIPQNRLYILLLMVNSLVSTYLFAYALRIYKHFSIKFLLLVSVLASIFYLMFNAGRLGILLFMLTFLIDFAYRKTKHPFIFISLFLVLGVFLLGAVDDLFFYLSYGYLKESSTGIVSIINEFSFPYLNLLNAFKINEIYGLRWGIDFISWIINVIPTEILKVFGLSKITSQYMFITEYYNSSSGLSSGIPTDLLTLGIRQFGIIGVWVVSILGSVLCKYFDKVIDKIHSEKFVFMTLRIASIMFIIVAYADLDSFVRSRYDMLMVLLFSIIVSKIRTKTKLNMHITKNIC